MGDDSGAASIDMLTGGLGRLIPKNRSRAEAEAEVRASQAKKYQKDADEYDLEYYDDAVPVDENGVLVPSRRPSLDTYLEENLIKSEVEALMKKQRISYKAKSSLSKMLSAVGRKVSPTIEKIKSRAKLFMPRGYSPAQPVFNNIKQLKAFAARIESSGQSWEDFIDVTKNEVFDPETGAPAAFDPIMELFMSKNNRRPKLSRTTEPEANEVAVFRGIEARLPGVDPVTSIHNNRRILSMAEHLQDWKSRRSMRVSVGGISNNGTGSHVTSHAGIASEYTGGDETLTTPAMLKFGINANKIKIDSDAEVEQRLIEILGPEHKKYTDPMSLTQKAALAGTDVYAPGIIDPGSSYESVILNRSAVRVLGTDQGFRPGEGNVYGTEGTLRTEEDFNFIPTIKTPKVLTPRKTLSEFLYNQLIKQKYNRFQIENLSISDRFKLLMKAQKQKISKQSSSVQSSFATKLRDAAYNRGLISPVPESRPSNPFNNNQMSEEEWLNLMLPNYKPSMLQKFFPGKFSSLLNKKAGNEYNVPLDSPWRSQQVPGLKTGGTINYDNTLANLHQGEMVLTQPLTQKLNDGINALSYMLARPNNSMSSVSSGQPAQQVASAPVSYYNLTVQPSPGMDEDALANRVVRKLKDHERRVGMARR
jgi:hypothetical protein